MQRQRETATYGCRDHAQAIVSAPLLDRLRLFSWEARLAPHDVAIASFTEPHADGGSIPYTTPSERIHPGLARATRHPDDGHVTCSQHGMDTEHWRQKGRICRVKLAHHRARPRDGVLATEHLTRERSSRHLSRGEQLERGETTHQSGERAGARRRLLDSGQSKACLQSVNSFRQRRLRSTSSR